MRLGVVGCVLMLILAAVTADTAVNSTESKEQDDDEYEDIAVAESQDIAHRQFYPNSDDPTHQPRSRPRGRKRRRRLRKRPRSTTPSFIEEYDPEKSVKEEEAPEPPVEEEAPYQRRRPVKRRRRPMRRKPEFETEVADPEVAVLQVDPEPPRENPPEEYYRPRNTQRRRRKGGRKRIRVTTELSYDSNNNNTNEEHTDGVTTQQPEVVVQSNDNPQDRDIPGEVSSSSSLDETTTSIFSKAFTPKEITEINHELESLSRLPSENEYQVSGLGAFSAFQHSVPDPSTRKYEENNVETTTKEYSWITRFDPQARDKLFSEVSTQSSVAFGHREEKKDNKEPKRNIKNIERIIENRKNLFSTSKRLPPTSAVIRRRLHPQKTKNLTTQETIIDNTIPTVDPSNLKFGKRECESIECALNRTRILSNNIIPSSLIPSGFPTMPEVLSTAELLQKNTKRFNNEDTNVLLHLESNDSDNQNRAGSNVIIITPSTLIRSQSDEDNVLIKEHNSEIKQPTISYELPNETTDVQTISSTSSQEDKHTVETSTASPTESKTTEVTATTEATTEKEPVAKDVQSDEATEDYKHGKKQESERLRLDGVDVSNINDEILEFIMDEMGQARVKRILELRNMTLSELIAHRERGAGHFSTFNSQNILQNQTKNDNSTKVLVTNTPEKTDSAQESLDQENMEKMIVEKAKLFLNEFKKPDENTSSATEISLEEKDKLDQTFTSISPSTTEPIQTPTIQFPEDGILGAFPKYMYDIAGKKSKAHTPTPNVKPSLFRESINKPREFQELNDKREPRVFESMPQFSSETSNKDSLEIFPYPDWRISVSKSTTEKTVGFPGISKEIMIAATSRSTSRSANLEEVILLDEGEEVHHLRNHILGGIINVDSDEDYPETKKVPASVKSAIAASGALLGLAILGFLAVLVSCKIRQRRARLRARRDILCEHLAEDFRCSQRSRTPVLRKSPFNNGIHSNTASNRHYYLWRTLRKTFQYE